MPELNSKIKGAKYVAYTYTKDTSIHVLYVQNGKIIIAPAIFNEHLNRSHSILHGRLLKAGFTVSTEDRAL